MNNLQIVSDNIKYSLDNIFYKIKDVLNFGNIEDIDYIINNLNDIKKELSELTDDQKEIVINYIK